jgi:two-component system sensor histidine kinase/response regulator
MRITLRSKHPPIHPNFRCVFFWPKILPYTLDFAENGQVAIDRFKSNQYDLVLMDIQMPVVDGYTAVRMIREWEQKDGRAQTPIIALTASALDEAVHKSHEVGCNAHVAKPVRKATLIAAIQNIIVATRHSAAADSG